MRRQRDTIQDLVNYYYLLQYAGEEIPFWLYMKVNLQDEV